MRGRLLRGATTSSPSRTSAARKIPPCGSGRPTDPRCDSASCRTKCNEVSVAVSYYIYYKVPAQLAAQLRPVVQELQRSMAAKTGVRGKLLCRRDKAETWMEVYEDVVDAVGFEAVL